MFKHVNPKNDLPSPLIAEDVYTIIAEVSVSAAAAAASCMTVFARPSEQSGKYCWHFSF